MPSPVTEPEACLPFSREPASDLYADVLFKFHDIVTVSSTAAPSELLIVASCVQSETVFGLLTSVMPATCPRQPHSPCSGHPNNNLITISDYGPDVEAAPYSGGRRFKSRTRDRIS
jgi:hypothetical protein